MRTSRRGCTSELKRITPPLAKERCVPHLNSDFGMVSGQPSRVFRWRSRII